MAAKIILDSSHSLILAIFIFYIYISGSTSAAMHYGKLNQYKPCKNLVLYFHNIIYNGQNAANATSAIVAAPQGGNMRILAVGRAQGFYIYDTKNTYTAWLGFSFVLNSTDHQGTITFIGADPLMNKTRDISVVGGTGDFFMARGIATIMTDAFEGEVYFRLRVEINLYECW
ncbi:hypothetical protein MKX01_015636 [Papaver californicum]|nr:hypothetical protein MKX01_015636 [Papaver californicum]